MTQAWCHELLKAIIIAAANDNISCTMLQDHITKHAKVKSEYTAIHGQPAALSKPLEPANNPT